MRRLSWSWGRGGAQGVHLLHVGALGFSPPTAPPDSGPTSAGPGWLALREKYRGCGSRGPGSHSSLRIREGFSPDVRSLDSRKRSPLSPADCCSPLLRSPSLCQGCGGQEDHNHLLFLPPALEQTEEGMLSKPAHGGWGTHLCPRGTAGEARGPWNPSQLVWAPLPAAGLPLGPAWVTQQPVGLRANRATQGESLSRGSWRQVPMPGEPCL